MFFQRWKKKRYEKEVSVVFLESIAEAQQSGSAATPAISDWGWCFCKKPHDPTSSDILEECSSHVTASSWHHFSKWSFLYLLPYHELQPQLLIICFFFYNRNINQAHRYTWIKRRLNCTVHACLSRWLLHTWKSKEIVNLSLLNINPVIWMVKRLPPFFSSSLLNTLWNLANTFIFAPPLKAVIRIW